MKKLLFLAAALYAAYIAYRWYSKPKTSLDDHLDEQATLQEIGALATRATNANQPAGATLDSRGPLDSIQFDPFSSIVDTRGTRWFPSGVLQN